MMPARVAVIGGGLAGITAAIRCADAGAVVTLLEGRPKLGGLTHSFRRGNLDVDNGQHVFLRCCTAYLDLLQRLGVREQVYLQERLDIVVRSEALARPTGLRRTGLPAPLHLSAALLRYRALTPSNRLRVIRGALALRSIDPTAAQLDQQSLLEWLTQHGQNRRTVAAMWDLFTVATLNVAAEQASLALAATVFQTGLLFDASAGDIGWSLIPLQQLHADAAARCLQTAGATVLTNTKVARLRANSGLAAVDAPDPAVGVRQERAPWTVIDRTGVEREFDQVVLAVDPVTCEQLLDPGTLISATTREPLAEGWAAGLSSSPILNAHLVFDRTVMTEPFFAGVDTPVQWAFDRTRQSGLGTADQSNRHQYVAVSLSAAEQLLALPTAELKAQIVPAFLRLVPAARNAELLDFFITREPAATFRPRPGSAALRPLAHTTMAGLAVAGAWTATGWPATMEGAVRSGNSAADVVIAATRSRRTAPLSARHEHRADMSTARK